MRVALLNVKYACDYPGSSAHTIVAAIRAAEQKGSLPVFVRLPKRTAGLTKDSLIECGHITTVAMEQLGRRLGTLPAELLLDLNTALKRSLALP